MQDRLGSEVVLTRTDDTYVPLEGRTKIANDAKADLFLSIHANSSPVKSVTGVETYYLNFTTSRAALDLAARENAPAESSIFDLKDVLEKIALRDKIDESREFASRLQTSLYTLTKTSTPAKNRGIKKAPFVVLIGAQMPSVLAEIGFLTNSNDEALMRKTEHRQKIAEALYKGIAAYAESLSQRSGRQARVGPRGTSFRETFSFAKDSSFGEILFMIKTFVLVTFAAASMYGASWTGEISDSACGASHAKMMAEHKDLKTDKDCTLACVKAGSKYVLVSDGKVFQIENQALPALQQRAGQMVSVTGDLKGDSITVTKISQVKKK